MKKLNKKDIINILLLIIFFIGIVFYLTKFKYLYGSTIDWETQHWSFAEYFRMLFYKNHQLFPSFAFNIGAGENIYNYSYYGFLNPILLISYFLPFLNMPTYIIISSILGVIISVILLYKWLINHTNRSITFISTFLFLCSAPLILHSHRHIMFVNYMPFLISALISIDKYFNDHKRWPLALLTFLIVMSSYYFSIPSLMVLVIYGIYVYLKTNKKITIKGFFKDGFLFLIPIMVGVLSASIILFPTLYTLFIGRSSNTVTIALKELIIPNLNIDYFLYGSYSIGLTSILLFSLIYGFMSKKRENIFISSVMTLIGFFPIIVFILNGFLYINAKVLIPFVPLMIYFIALFLNDLFQDKVNIKKEIIAIFILTFVAFITKWHNFNYLINTVYLLDIGVVIVGFLIYKYKKIKWVLMASLILPSFITMIANNTNDELMSIENYNKIFNPNINILYDEIDPKELYRSSNLVDTLVTSNKVYNLNYYNTSVYSSGYNSYYKEFYTETFANPISHRNHMILSQINNPLWNTYMGIKYLVSNYELPEYSLIDKKDDYYLYQNNGAYPIGYARDNLMSYEEFNKLDYPQNIEALLKYTIVDEDVKSNYTSTLKEYKLDLDNITNPNITVKETENKYLLEVSKKSTINIPLNNDLKDKILLIRFKMNYEQKCNKGDTSITINKVKNTLTCESWKYKNNNHTFDYAFINPNNLKVTFSKGTFDISDIKAYLLDYKEILNIKNNLNSFNFDLEKTTGDVIEGDINVLNDSYFTLSIPYDTGFKVYVNDKEIAYNLVNTAFMGFPINKGNNHIKIIYTSPFKNISLIFSGLGLIGIIILFINDKKRGKK